MLTNNMAEYRENFSKWIRENKAKQYRLKILTEQYEFWRCKWMSVGGINYEVERVQGGTGIDPHMQAFYRMLEIEEKIKEINADLHTFFSFQASLKGKQRLFFDEVLIKNYRISEFCKKNNVSLSRGYELKNLIVWLWYKTNKKYL